MSEKSLRSRTVKALDDDIMASPNGRATNSSSSSPRTQSTKFSTKQQQQQQHQQRRNPPYLPTSTETLALAIYPVLLTFGTLFSVLNPQANSAPYDPSGQAHIAASAPSYFARKDNIVNIWFVKRGWAWFTVAFIVFLLTSPALSNGLGMQRKVKAMIRYALVTGWWVLVTQWCFGPAIIDRGFRYTGGKCEVAELAVEDGVADKTDAFTAVACKASGGRWAGGHDISGHVFMLMLGSWFLVQEVGWVLLRASRGDDVGSTVKTTAVTGLEERTVVMADGAVKGAGVEAADDVAKGGNGGFAAGAGEGMGLGGKFAAVVVALSYWMLLMTAIYFHTWFEKVTGFLVASVAMYAVYILPRFSPQVRSIVGLPGI